MQQNITIGEKYKPAMAITDETEAAEYFEKCVQHSVATGYSREEAEEIERTNLGYFAGYYDNATRGRVERLFHCEHPIFGSLDNGGGITAHTALSLGKNKGTRI